MARAKAEQQQPATGTTLIVMVGLAIAFLLFMAFLNVVKSGNILNETNLLFATLIFYSGAGALYLGFGVTGTESYVKFASLATWLGLLCEHGRHCPPLVRSWTCAVFQRLRNAAQLRVDAGGAHTRRRKEIWREGHWHGHHAGGDCGRGADAVAADRGASAGSRLCNRPGCTFTSRWPCWPTPPAR